MSRFTHASRVGAVIDIPAALVTSQERFNGAAGRAFVAELPHRAAGFLGRWSLRLDGPSMYGMCALVLPVLRADGTRAALKLQYLDEETAGEPIALRTWGGDGAVRLLEYDDGTGTLLLERLDASRALTHEPDSRAAALVIARLLARLTAVSAPPELHQRLGPVAAAMLEQTPSALPHLPDPADRRLIEDCAAAVREVADEPGDRLLHWDLHYDNVLGTRPATESGTGTAPATATATATATEDRGPWLAIDPKPLAGDPGFELFPALDNRFDPDDIRWRFDAMTDVIGLDRARARAWTLGRVLQNALWSLADGRAPAPDHLEIARRLRDLH
ncbi:aminoglycoside phosphotransferase family protein [Streptomyces sp. NPDC010273]|uniref:aminoglycoside phosphotransferase family protein n=1 Tax=Streptomyces sp. NPDC010273 TaxID=3364829 RepID=UPI0036ED54E1